MEERSEKQGKPIEQGLNNSILNNEDEVKNDDRLF
jgi:hypothetical protein